MKLIDPHLHLFNLTQGDYHWLDSKAPPFWPDKAIINRNFCELDLALNKSTELAGFVHIEAGFDNEQPWKEIEYLESSCLKPFSCIAAIDLLAPSDQFTVTLEKLISYNSMVGVRHILDEQAGSILNDTQALNNFNSLNQHKLVFETQLPLASINEKDDKKENNQSKTITTLRNVIANNRNTTFIINHAGFPPLNSTSQAWRQWKNNLAKLANNSNTVIKCSGWEMIDRKYNEQWLSACLSACIEAFSVERVMLASNFPLCLFSHKSYNDYWSSIINSTILGSYSTQQKSALLYSNALKFYRL